MTTWQREELVAEKVMAYVYEGTRDGASWIAPDMSKVFGTPDFSTKIEGAWRVVERMFALGWDVHIGRKPSEHHSPAAPYEVSMFRGDRAGFSMAETIQEAICVAALRALRVSVETPDFG